MKAKIITKDWCPFCVKAKNLLIKHGIEFNEYELGKDIYKEQLLEILPDAKSVPQIWLIDGEQSSYLGGYSELEEFLK
jgi:glutaredoxin